MEWKLIQMSRVTWPRWLPCLYMLKTFKKPNYPEPFNGWPWNLACSIGYPSTTKIIQMLMLGWLWFFYGKVKYAKMLMHRILLKVLKILAYKWVIRVVLSTWRFVSRRGHGHCLTFDPGFSYSMTISNISSTARFHVEPPWAEGTEYVQTVLMTNMATTPIYGKNLLKSSAPEPINPWPWNLICSIGNLSTI